MDDDRQSLRKTKPSGDQSRSLKPVVTSESNSIIQVPTKSKQTIPSTSKWLHIEQFPNRLAPSPRPRAIMLSAPWCQWCGVAKSELDANQDARNQLGHDFDLSIVDVDRHPTWLDLPDFHGLPAFAFFNRSGQLLLLRSGYLPLPQLVQTFEAVAHRIREGSMTPYPEPNEGQKLLSATLSSEQAKAELKRLELKIYLRINSQDGGFDTPARFPYPELIFELQRWKQAGAPQRVESWIINTIQSASRGSSPRLNHQTLPGFPYDATTLQSLAKKGAKAGQSWRNGIDHLPDADPYLGLQDPIDGGYFRYAAGPGWYQPHFERRALDNLSWAMLLQQRSRRRASKRVEEFVDKTFRNPTHGLFAAVQHSNPFYYRLRREERVEVHAPKVDPLWKLDVQARAARLNSRHCPALLRVSSERWPDELWSDTATIEHAGPATPNAVGELLLALASCPGKPYALLRTELLDTIVDHWRSHALPQNARLSRLAAGICAVSKPACGQALASTLNIDFDPNYPPPLLELAELADSIEVSRHKL